MDAYVVTSRSDTSSPPQDGFEGRELSRGCYIQTEVRKTRSEYTRAHLLWWFMSRSADITDYKLITEKLWASPYASVRPTHKFVLMLLLLIPGVVSKIKPVSTSVFSVVMVPALAYTVRVHLLCRWCNLYADHLWGLNDEQSLRYMQRNRVMVYALVSPALIFLSFYPPGRTRLFPISVWRRWKVRLCLFVSVFACPQRLK
jgi:hypothetical protein